MGDWDLSRREAPAPTDLWPIPRCPWRGTPTWRRPVALGAPLRWRPRSPRCASGPRNSRASSRRPPAGSCRAHQTDLRRGGKPRVTWNFPNPKLSICTAAIGSILFPEWSHEGRWIPSQRKLCRDANSRHRLSLFNNIITDFHIHVG